MSSPRGLEIADAADSRLEALLRRTDATPHATLGSAYHDRRVADVLAHLHAWHLIFDGWIAQDRAGSTPAFPAEGYSWSDLRALNDALYEAHRERPYDAVRTMTVASHKMMLALLDTFSQEDLTDPARFPWTGGEPLGSVAHECLGGHYEWALGVLDDAGVP
jgi:hypothetical protein